MRLKDKLSVSAYSYLLVNIIIAGVVIAIIIYSAVFSADHNSYPLKCVHEQVTGLPCPSCGLSRSFSSIVRGDLESANEWNRYGIRVFLFFLFQLLLRITISIQLLRKKIAERSLVVFDIVASVVSFMAGLGQFAVYYWKMLV